MTSYCSELSLFSAFSRKNPAPKCGIFACIFFVNASWSEWRDLNPRPLGPELHADFPIRYNKSKTGDILPFCAPLRLRVSNMSSGVYSLMGQLPNLYVISAGALFELKKGTSEF